MTKLVKPTIENVENSKIHFWSYCDLDLENWWKLVPMSFKTSKRFIFNDMTCIKNHLTSNGKRFVWFLKTKWLKKFIYVRMDFHFYFPIFSWCKSMMCRLSKTLSVIKFESHCLKYIVLNLCFQNND